MMHRSKAAYLPAHDGDSRSKRKQAVVDRYNQLYDQHKGTGAVVDWGELFAELVDAYCQAE